MKKMILMAAVAASLCACGGGVQNVTSISTMSDSVSYAFGTYVGGSVKGQFGAENPDFDVNVFAAAIKESMESDSATLMTQQEIQSTLQNYFTVVKPARDKAVEEEYFAGVLAENANAVKTESGLVYEIVEAGDAAAMPVMNDTISVLYTGTFTNGDVFDSTDSKGGAPLDLVLGQVIPGWNEGLQLVGKGGKLKLWIPAALAYGNQTMLFDVELVDIKSAAEAK